MSLLDNAALTFKIKSDLIFKLNLGNVNVDSEEGVVTLRGTVAYDNLRQQAEEIALQHGARRVINELTVLHPGESAVTIPEDFPRVTTPEGAPPVEQPPPEEAVRAALESDPRVNARLILVRVDNGIAYLTGRQETVDAVEAATEVAAHVPGILGVSNELEVMPSV